MMAIYLSDFDKTLSPPPLSFDKAPLLDQLIFSAVVGEEVYISTASPFKNLVGWREINYCKCFLADDIIKFPLDPIYGGYPARYINSRIKKISQSDDVFKNPESQGYVSKKAENILNVIDNPDFVINRVEDCDLTFRKLVLSDMKSEFAGSILSLSKSKKNIYGSDEFLSYAKETAENPKQLFQRFSLIEHCPTEFICDKTLKDKICNRLDELFFKANSMAANVTQSDNFYTSTANYFRTFCMNYKIKSFSLYKKIINSNPSDLLRLRHLPAMQQLVSDFKLWLSESSNLLYEAQQLGNKKALSERLIYFSSKLIQGILCVGLAEILATLLSHQTGIQIPFIDEVFEPIIFIIPFISDMVKKTPAQKVFEFLSAQ
jgi:hypothetical protein